MIATSHVIIGGAVGSVVGLATANPFAALGAGFASHLVCDLIPHLDHPPAPKDKNGDLIWTPAVWIFAFSDSIIGWLVILYLWVAFFDFPTITPFIAGAVGGYLPDFIDNVPFWKNKIRTLPGFHQFHTFHENIHAIWGKRFPMPKYATLGVATQVVTVGISLWWLFSY